jgi:hypothetical protein
MFEFRIAELIANSSAASIGLPFGTLLPVTFVRTNTRNNTPYEDECRTIAANTLATDHHKPVAIITRKEGVLWVSMRSLPTTESALDVATRFGGDGTDELAEFSVPCSENPFRVQKNHQ